MLGSYHEQRKICLVSNRGSGTISSYRIGSSDGTLTLLNPVAANTGMDSAPRDVALNNSGHFLYVQTSGGQSVVSYRVEQDGSLTMIDTDTGLPFGAQGIATK